MKNGFQTLHCVLVFSIFLLTGGILHAGYDEDLAALNYTELTVFPVNLSSVFNTPFPPTSQNFWPMEPFQNNPHYRHVEGPNKWYIHNAVQNPVSPVYAPAAGLIRTSDIGTLSTIVSVNGKDYYLDTQVAVHHSSTIWTHNGHIALLKDLADRVQSDSRGYVQVAAGEEIGAQYFGPSETLRHGLDFRVVNDALYNDIVLDPESGMNKAVNPLNAFSSSMKAQILLARKPFDDAVKASGLYPSYLLEDNRINFNIPGKFWGLWFKDDQDSPLDFSIGQDWSVVKFIRTADLSDDTFWKFKQDHPEVAGLMASRPNTGSNPQGTKVYAKSFREDGYLILESGDEHTGIMRHVYFTPSELVYVYYRYEVVDNGPSKHDDKLKLQGFNTLVEAQAGFTSDVAIFRRSETRTSIVQGTIRNGLGQGIPNAKVELESTSHALVATTDSSGFYSMLVPVSSHASLSVTNSSYQSTTLSNLTFPADQTVTVNGTMADITLTAPTIRGTVLSSTTVRWDWDNVTGANGYRVLSVSSTNVSGDLSSGVTSFVEYGLTPNTSISRRVVAFNSTESQASSLVSTQTYAATPLSLIISTKSATTATIYWGTNGNPNGTVYRIYLYEVGGSTATFDSTSSTYVLTGLSPLKNLFVSVRALDDQGHLTDANTAAFGSFITLAASPNQLQLKSRSSTSITIQWGANGNPSGTTYRVTFSTSGISDIVQDITALETTFTGLDVNKGYHVTVQALSQDSSLSSIGADNSLNVYTKCNSVTNLQILNLGVHRFNVQWDSNGNSNGTLYQIVASNSVETKNSDVMSSTSALISNLIGETAYTVKVIAFGIGGDSSESATISTTTAKAVPVNKSINPSIVDTVAYEGKFGAIQLQIPANTFQQSVDLTVDVPASLPSGSSTGNRLDGVGVGVQIDIANGKQPANEVQIKVCYDETNVTGRNEKKFVLARWNPTTSLWLPLPSTVDSDNNCVIGLTNHFSIFQLMQASALQDFSSAKVYPNPFQPSKGQASIHFDNLTDAATIKVYTMTGSLVTDLTADGSGTASWNGLNSAGEEVSSGTYYALLEGNGIKKILKVVIQR